MADKVVIEGVHPTYDGEYDFEGEFTNRELHTIKRLSGCRVGELNDALAASDTDVVMAIGIIVLQRHGKQINEDVFWDAEAGNIRMEFDEAEADADPPPPQKPAGGNGSSGPSGNDSSVTSAPRANGQSPTGQPPSGTPATSEYETLAR